MTTSRVGGPGAPEPSKDPNQETKAQREQKQRVEKVREVDPDEQARNRRRDQFKMMMEGNEEMDETSPAPSPYETSFYQSEANTKAFPNADQAAIPSPSSAPAPNVNIPGNGEEDVGADGLPQSESFWSDVDTPDSPMQMPQMEQEKDQSKTVTPEGKAKKKGVVPGLEIEMGGKKKGSEAKSGKKGLEPSPFESTGKKDDKTAPTAKYWTSDAPIEHGIGGKSKGKGSPQKEDEQVAMPQTPTERGSQEKKPENFLSKEFHQAFEKADPDKERNKKKTDSSAPEIIAPATPGLPADILPYAVAAATQAAPYLSPEVLPLFYQMVGSIMIMTTPPGISRTEVVLNSANFANSKFYGSTIEIIKYSTAPDSLNIHLRGSNEAVEKFRQNIPSLMTSFQSGKFNFRIGRLEASYSAARPIFRRRDKREGGSMSGGADSDTKGGR